MKKRMLITLSIVAIFLAAIGLLKFREVRATIAQHASFQPPPEAVTTIVAHRSEWPDSLRAIGTAVAVQGVTVSADLPGIVDRIDFESGRTVKKGVVLVQLDVKQETAQLAAAEARLKLARLSYERLRGLRDSGVVAQADYDKAAADQSQAEAAVGEIRATIERKTIRAPFSGLLGIRQVNLGQYLAAGDKVVPLQSLDPIYANFSVPQQDVARLRTGERVRITAGEPAGSLALSGKVTAIDSVVDPATRNVQVQATFANPDGRLQPGMFVDAETLLGTSDSVVALPASSIGYAPYGDSVFVVSDMKHPDGSTYKGVQQRFVKLGRSRGDQVAVVSGLDEGQEVVTSGVFKLRSGAAVVVNNKVQPANNPSPKPQDS